MRRLPIRSHVGCLGWTILIFLVQNSGAGQFKEIDTDGTAKLIQINELGVPVGGKDHLLFEIKGKGQAYIILSESIIINPRKGKYYSVILAVKHKDGTYRMNGIKYGCVQCSAFSTTAIATTMVADKFTQLWISWKNGHIKVGRGTSLNQSHPLLDYKGPQTYGVNFIGVSTYHSPGQWRFRVDNPPVFIVPLPSGSTTISVPENSPVNKALFNIMCEDPENDTITLTQKNHVDLFHIVNSTVTLKHILDYEKDRQYSLKIEAFDGLHTVLVAMSVKVVDVNDEIPVLKISDDLSIPEELRVGTVLGGLFDATDADRNDDLKYNLQGGHNYFAINEANGKLTLKRRIDFDGVRGVKKIDKMTLTVTDKGNNRADASLMIPVIDINDNTPSFGDIYFHFNVTEHGGQTIQLANFAITDADSGGNGKVRFGLPNTVDKNIFTVQGTSLMVDASKIDYEELEKQDFAYTLTVGAIDMPDTGRVNVGKATVVVEVLPVNEFYPKWTSPKLQANSFSFEDKAILMHDPVGTIVETFRAKDDDKGKDGTVTYRIISVKSDKGEDVGNHFFMDMYSGQLKKASHFDIKAVSSSFDITVQAVDGGSSPKSVNGKLKVSLGFDSAGGGRVIGIGGAGGSGAGGAVRMGGAGGSGAGGAVGMGGEGMGGSGGSGAGGAVGMGGAGMGGEGMGGAGRAGAGEAVGMGGAGMGGEGMGGAGRAGAGRAVEMGGAGMGGAGGSGAGRAVGMGGAGIGGAGGSGVGGAVGMGGAGMGGSGGSGAGRAVGMGGAGGSGAGRAVGMEGAGGSGAGRAVGMGGAGMGGAGGSGASAAVGMGGEGMGGEGMGGAGRAGAGRAVGMGGAGMGGSGGSGVGRAVGMGGAGIGGAGGSGAGGAVGMGGAGGSGAGEAVGMGDAGKGVGGGAGAGAGGEAGMRGGISGSLGVGTGGIGGAGIAVGGGAGARGAAGMGEGMRAGSGIDKGRINDMGSDSVSGKGGDGRFGGHKRPGEIVGTGTGTVRGAGEAGSNCVNGGSGCFRGTDKPRDGLGRSVHICSTVASHRNNEVWALRGGYGLLLFLGALGSLAVMWKIKKKTITVTPASTANGLGLHDCPGLAEFKAPAPIDTHR